MTDVASPPLNTSLTMDQMLRFTEVISADQLPNLSKEQLLCRYGFAVRKLRCFREQNFLLVKLNCELTLRIRRMTNAGQRGVSLRNQKGSLLSAIRMQKVLADYYKFLQKEARKIHTEMRSRGHFVRRLTLETQEPPEQLPVLSSESIAPNISIPGDM